MWWGELPLPLLCGSPRCDIFLPWGAVPMGISQGPFLPGETEAWHSALLHPRLEGQRVGGDRGDMPLHPP